MIIDDIQERWFPFWASRVITRKPTDSVANELPEVLVSHGSGVISICQANLSIDSRSVLQAGNIRSQLHIQESN